MWFGQIAFHKLDFVDAAYHYFRILAQLRILNLAFVIQPIKNVFHTVYSRLFLIVRSYDGPGGQGRVGLKEHLELAHGVFSPQILSLHIYW